MKTSYLSCTSPNCKKTFRNEVSFDKHLSEDHCEAENLPLLGYRCKKCRKVLQTKQSLQEHFYTHTGQKPYKCSLPGCGKYFRQSSQLSYHRRTHYEAIAHYKESIAARIQNNLLSCFSPSLKLCEGIEITEVLYKLPKITSPQLNVKLPSIFSVI